MAYKLYKELERLIKTLDIELSVDKAIDIAKTISTITFKLPDGSTDNKVILTTPEQKLLEIILPNVN